MTFNYAKSVISKVLDNPGGLKCMDNIVISNYIGFFITDISAPFCEVECPCGVKVGFKINEIPTKDTPHPCGNPDHWTVKIGK